MNRLLTGLFGLISWPLWGLGSMGVLVVVSFLSALLALWIFGRYSNQEAIRKVRNRIRGNMLAVRPLAWQASLGMSKSSTRQITGQLGTLKIIHFLS